MMLLFTRLLNGVRWDLVEVCFIRQCCLKTVMRELSRLNTVRRNIHRWYLE